jgi:hypothetical protein
MRNIKNKLIFAFDDLNEDEKLIAILNVRDYINNYNLNDISIVSIIKLNDYEFNSDLTIFFEQH